MTDVAKMKEEIEIVVAQLQMDYYFEKNQSGTVREYVKSKLQEGVQSSSGAAISCDESDKIKYNGKEVGVLEADWTVTMNGEVGGAMKPTEPVKPEKPLATEIIKPENYGDVVNYSANGVNDWKVFLNDGSNVYIIASDYVPSSGMTMTSDVERVDGNDYCMYGNSRDVFVDWLTIESNWSAYAEGINGAIAVGEITREQFLTSYNEKYGTSYSGEKINLVDHVGYDDELYFPHKESWNSTNAYWLNSPNSANSSYLGIVRCDEGSIDAWNLRVVKDTGLRPLVCLPVDAKMAWNGTTWDLSN